jgi:hypothetical protein
MSDVNGSIGSQGTMTSDKPTPGTYGALTRSTEPWPWRELQQRLTWSADEWALEGPSVVFRKANEVFKILKERQ